MPCFHGTPDIPDDGWQSIEYPNAIYDEAEQVWVSDAEVTEVALTAFTGRRKADHVTCRLVVRRIKRLRALASDGTEQGELFATFRHHAFTTNSALALIEADQTPPRARDHRAGHRRAQGRTPRAPAFRELRRERSLAVARSDRVQHRPRIRRRCRSSEDPVGHPA